MYAHLDSHVLLFNYSVIQHPTRFLWLPDGSDEFLMRCNGIRNSCYNLICALNIKNRTMSPELIGRTHINNGQCSFVRHQTP